MPRPAANRTGSSNNVPHRMMRRLLRGSIIGVAGGSVSALFGELLVKLVARLFPTDVGATGLVVVWVIPMGLATGAFLGWRRRLPAGAKAPWITAAPGLLPGLGVAFIQWAIAQ